MICSGQTPKVVTLVSDQCLASCTKDFCLDSQQGWGVSPRGAGFLFGSDVVQHFNTSNDIEMICRAHQLVMEGYKWHFNETVLTVWSAPNYCYRYFDDDIPIPNWSWQWLFKDAETLLRSSNSTKTCTESSRSSRPPRKRREASHRKSRKPITSYETC